DRQGHHGGGVEGAVAFLRRDVPRAAAGHLRARDFALAAGVDEVAGEALAPGPATRPSHAPLPVKILRAWASSLSIAALNRASSSLLSTLRNFSSTVRLTLSISVKTRRPRAVSVSTTRRRSSPSTLRATRPLSTSRSTARVTLS